MVALPQFKENSEERKTPGLVPKRKTIPVKIETKIKGLIQDLSSDNPKKVKRAEKQLLEFGEKAVPYLFEASLDINNDRRMEEATKIIEAMNILALPFLISNLEESLVQGNTAYYLANRIIMKTRFESLPQQLVTINQLDKILRTGKTTEQRMLAAYLLGSTNSGEAANRLLNSTLDKNAEIAKETERQILRLGKIGANALIDAICASAEYDYKYKDGKPSSEKRRLDELANKADAILVRMGDLAATAILSAWDKFDAQINHIEELKDKENENAEIEEERWKKDHQAVREAVIEVQQNLWDELLYKAQAWEEATNLRASVIYTRSELVKVYYKTLPYEEKEKYKYAVSNFDVLLKNMLRQRGIPETFDPSKYDATKYDVEKEIVYVKEEKLQDTFKKIPGVERFFINELKKDCDNWNKNANGDVDWVDSKGETLGQHKDGVLDNLKKVPKFVSSKEAYIDFLVTESGKTPSATLKKLLDDEIQKTQQTL